jgi:hypothetical protein
VAFRGVGAGVADAICLEKKLKNPRFLAITRRKNAWRMLERLPGRPEAVNP